MIFFYMRILVVGAFCPYPIDSGGRRRLFAIFDGLRDFFEITMIFPVFEDNEIENVFALQKLWPNVLIVPFYGIKAPYEGTSMAAKIMRFFHVLNPHTPPWFLKKQYGMAALIKAMTETGEYDLIHVEFTQMLSYLPKDCPIPSVAVEQDVSFIAWERRFKIAKGLKNKLTEFLLMQKVKRFELKHLKEFDRIVTVSDVDRERLQKVLATKEIEVVPNGVDLDYFQFESPERLRLSLLYNGGFGHFPNLDAMRLFINDIFPLIKQENTDINLKIVGKVTEKEALEFANEKNAEFLGLEHFVDDREYLDLLHSSIFIVPLRIGGGTRLKILEALSAGCPVVSTTIGAEGLGAINEEHLLIADKPEDFAKACQRLIVDQDLRIKLAQNGRRLVEEKFGWGRIVEKQKKIYEELINRGHTCQESSCGRSHPAGWRGETFIRLGANPLKNAKSFNHHPNL